LNRRSKGGTKVPKEITVIGSVAGLVGLAALLHVVHAGPTLTFICCALALAGVAHVIGEATDQLGNHLGPAATGIVQSAFGNLPELFVCIFALQAGLVTVVQTSLIGSILGNALLVLGLAFVAGGPAEDCCRGQVERLENYDTPRHSFRRKSTKAFSAGRIWRRLG